MREIAFTQAEFVGAAFTKEQFPKLMTLQGTPMLEIACVGRSNVGKSSLINHLLRDSSLAKTSSTPGKTQSINFFSIDDKIALVDLPGYGYAKVPKELRARWAEIIDHYLENRAPLRLILFLIDSRRDLTEEDYAFVKWAQFHQKPLLLIFTKADKLSENEKRKRSALVPDHENLWGFGYVKAPRLNDRKQACINSIQTCLRSFNRGSFHVSPNSKDFRGRVPDFSFLHYSIKDSRARIDLIKKINTLLNHNGPDQ